MRRPFIFFIFFLTYLRISAMDSCEGSINQENLSFLNFYLLEIENVPLPDLKSSYNPEIGYTKGYFPTSHYPYSAHSKKDVSQYYGESGTEDSLPKDDPIINPYWKSLINTEQEEKNSALKKLLADLPEDSHYYILRRNIYDAVQIGANPDVLSLDISLVFKTVFYNDTPLLGFLINHGLNLYNEKMCLLGDLPIYYARTKSMVELLLKNGADINYKSKFFNAGLLYHAMSSEKDLDLVPFFKEKGLSPFDYSNNGNTPLHHLALDSLKKKAKQKVSFLLDNLAPKGIITLINCENKDKKTVFQILTDENSKKSIKLSTILKGRLNKAKQDEH